MNKQDKSLVAGLLVIIGVVALSAPNCQGGCKTWATHFLTHGLKALI
jgi:hypothetical protein